MAIACVISPAAHGAVTAKDVETRIKAAYLYHFCNYVRWPETAFAAPNDPLVLGVAAADSVVDDVRRVVAGRSAGGHPIVVRKVSENDDLRGLHALFIEAAFEPRAQRLLDSAEEQPILIVTETALGDSAINFVVENDRVRFDIAPEAIRRRQLDVSAQLLTVARVIREPEG